MSLLLAGMIWGAAAAGRGLPLPESVARLRLGDCAPPCWVGIVPGVTTIGEAKGLMVRAFVEGSGRTIRDSGSANRYRNSTTVENTIVGEDFLLIARLKTGALVDGRSEVVESIELFQAEGGPTVGEILGMFGPPDGIEVEAFTTLGYEISLRYQGLAATFYTATNRVALDERAHIALERPGERAYYRPWRGFRTLGLRD
jgi:hypothetical protein